MDTARPTSPASDAWFVTTHWSVVLSAREPASPQSAIALETLCRTYWYPLYAYARRQGRPPHDAQDLTQGFFHEVVLGRDLPARADQAKGRHAVNLAGNIVKSHVNRAITAAHAAMAGELAQHSQVALDI